MKINDAISGALLMALAIAILVTIQSFPKIPGQNIGPGAFPGPLAVLLAFSAVLLIVRGLKERATQPWVTFGAWLRSPRYLRNFAVTVACLLFYIALSGILGFIICGIVVLCAMMWTLRTRPQVFIPVAIVATLVVHTIFYKGLRVPLPWGVLQPLAW
jgi:putative tricarboxylic transport membrane protein